MLGNEILHEDSILRMAVRRNVVFAVWNDAPAVAQIRAFQRAAELVSKRGRGEDVLVSVVVSGVPKFAEGVQDELVRVMKSRALFPLGTAHLIRLEGMAGVAVRAFLSTVKLLSKTPAPVGVFSKAEEALLWTLDRLRGSPERWTYVELKEALDQAAQGR